MPRFSSALAAALLVSTPLAAQTERHTIAGDRIAIHDLAGKVDLVAGNGSEVVVVVTRGGDDAGKLKIAKGSRDGANDLRVIFPNDDIVYPMMGRWSNSTVNYDADGYIDQSDRRGRGDRVRVRGSGRGVEAWADLRIEVPAGKTVHVHVAAGEMQASNVKGTLRLDGGAGRVRARGIEGSLTVDAGSGGVEVEDIKGDLSVETGSGGVRVDNVTGGAVKLETGSGGVRGARLSATELNIDVGSGGVDLGRVSAERGHVESGSGSLNIAFTNSPKDLKIETGSGGATLSFPPSLNATVDIDTGSGGIDNEFAVQVTRAERHSLRGKIGNGDGRIRVDTGSGGVRLLKN